MNAAATATTNEEAKKKKLLLRVTERPDHHSCSSSVVINSARLSRPSGRIICISSFPVPLHYLFKADYSLLWTEAHC